MHYRSYRVKLQISIYMVCPYTRILKEERWRSSSDMKLPVPHMAGTGAFSIRKISEKLKILM
jgi:hypothetical protein